MFILSMKFQWFFYIHPVSDCSWVCCKTFKSRKVYSFFTLAPEYKMDVLSWLTAYQKLKASSVLLISSFIVIVRMFGFFLCLCLHAESFLPFVFWL